MGKRRARGIWVGSKRACLVEAVAADGQVRLGQAVYSDLPEPQEGSGWQGREAGLRELVGRGRGRLVWACPAEQMLLRVMEFPAVEEDELAAMVEIQLDKISPQPLDRMYWDFELIYRGREKVRVMVAAVGRELVDQAGRFFAGIKQELDGVDCAALGLWDRLRTEEVEEGVWRIWLVGLEAGMLLLVSDEHGPLEYRVVEPVAAGEAADALAQELADEISYMLATLEAQWGAAAGVSITFVGEGQEPEWLGRLAELLELPVTTREQVVLEAAAGGVAARALAEERTVDLAPREWAERRRYRRARRRLIAAGAGVLLVWLSLMGAAVAFLGLEERRLQEVLDKQQAVEKPAAELRELRRKVRGLQLYADRSHSVLETLREAVSLMPDGVELTSFVYKKGRSVQLRGTCHRTEPIYEFFSRLEKSEFFTAVKPQGVTTRRRGREVISEFSVTCELPGEEG